MRNAHVVFLIEVGNATALGLEVLRVLAPGQHRLLVGEVRDRDPLPRDRVSDADHLEESGLLAGELLHPLSHGLVLAGMVLGPAGGEDDGDGHGGNPRLGPMSVRVYTGPHSDRGGGASGWITYLPWAFAAATILGQIVWVLMGDGGRTILSILTVVTFFLASASHAFLARGAGWAFAYLGISLSFGWAIELLGLTTSFPFGDYVYSPELGITVFGVPLVIPMAWSMMAYPCLLAAQRLSATGLGTALIGGWVLAAWDLFLDPQMVGEGFWSWPQASWELPGISGIPFQNFLGWLLSAIVLMWLLDRLPRKNAADAVPTTLLTWVFASSVFANLVFFGRPGVALWGGVCMGAVVIPYLWRMWSQPQW